jgi:hypothetical protein
MINKNWAFALSILSLSTALVAADQASTQQTNPPMPMGVTSQPTGVITPPVAPAVNHGADLFISADFIYWKAYQNGLEYANSAVAADPTTPPATLAQGSYATPKGEFQPGFKVGLGLEFEHDGWDLFAQYTWLAPTSKTTSTVAPTAPNGLYAVVGSLAAGNALGVGPASLSSASAKFTMHYNVVDLEVGRNFFLSRYMTLRPHFGLKADWITQRMNVSQDFLGVEFSGLYNSEQSNHKLKTWGLGIRCGLDPVWHFSRSWGMYGEFAFSALYSRFKNKGTDTLYTGAAQTGTTAQYANGRQSYHGVTPVLELGLGLSYMGWFYDEAYMLEVKAGWEEQVWFLNNQLVNGSTSGNGNMSTQGFTFKVGFHF